MNDSTIPDQLIDDPLMALKSYNLRCHNMPRHSMPWATPCCSGLMRNGVMSEDLGRSQARVLHIRVRGSVSCLEERIVCMYNVCIYIRNVYNCITYIMCIKLYIYYITCILMEDIPFQQCMEVLAYLSRANCLRAELFHRPGYRALDSTPWRFNTAWVGWRQNLKHRDTAPPPPKTRLETDAT